MSKKVDKAISEHFRKLGKASWASRKRKLLEKAQKLPSLSAEREN